MPLPRKFYRGPGPSRGRAWGTQVAVVRLSSKKRQAALLLVTVLIAMAFPLVSMGSAQQSGGVGLEDSSQAGCHCHNTGPDPGVTLNLMGLPERYEPGETYDLILSVAGGPPITEGMIAQGGFMISCTNGTFAIPEGSDMVQVFAEDLSASHTLAGNKVRQWRILWRAPREEAGDAVFYLSVNSVNGDGVETGDLDQYNTIRAVSLGEPKAAEGDEGASEWGIPIAAYWVGTIAFLATLVLTWAAYYLIRGTSRHHQVHIGSKERYVVEEQTPPSSYGAAILVAILTIIELASAFLLVEGIVEGRSDTALAVNLAVVLGLFVMILAIYRSAFIPRLTSIEPEDPGPGTEG
jgi:hypothetical protein